MIAHGAPIWEREAVLDLPVHGIDPEVRPGRYLPIASRLGPAEQANLGICAHGYVPGGVAPLIGQGAPSVDPDEALWERLRAR